MPPRHVVIVSRRFWPLIGSTATHVAHLAGELHRRDVQLTVLTPLGSPHWPRSIVHHGATVIRLPQPAVRGWGDLRYQRALTRWLRANADTYDLVYVANFGKDAATAIQVCHRHQCPIVVRYDGLRSTKNNIARSLQNIARLPQPPDAVVVPLEQLKDPIVDAGLPATRIHLIADGVPLNRTQRTSSLRQTARDDLGTAGKSFQLAADTPLAVFAGRLAATKQLELLIDAWSLVVRRRPNATLWIVGEGPQSRTVTKYIRLLDLRKRIILTGTFDCIDQVLLAADLLVLPSGEDRLSLSLLEAMASGLPVVASDQPAHRHVIQHEREGLLVTPGQPRPLADAILRVLDQPEFAQMIAERARQRVSDEFAVGKMADEHLELFQRLMVQRAS